MLSKTPAHVYWNAGVFLRVKSITLQDKIEFA